MKTKLNQFYFSLMGAGLLALGACSTNDNDTGVPQRPIPENTGFFILNEGPSQNSTLSFLSYASGTYSDNVASLGKGGNDMVLYGSKIYVTVTDDNKLVILDADSREQLSTVNITLPRSVISYRGKIYVTSQGDNKLVAVDTTSFSTNSVTVGNSPEQLTATGGKIYVANSGWREKLNGGDYDDRISVVDPANLTVTSSITVAKNLVSIAADTVKNILYVNASDTYEGSTQTSPSKLYVVNTANNQTTSMNFGAEEMVIIPRISQAFLISHNYNNSTSGKGQLLAMDLSSQTVQNFQSSTSIDNAYSLDLLPEANLLAVGDAKDYTSNGSMVLFLYNGSWSPYGQQTVGVSPKAFGFYVPPSYLNQ